MEYELSVAPTGEPLTIEDVEAFCQFGELPADQRATVKHFITVARQMVERRLRRQLMTATWIGYLDGFPSIIEIKDKLPVSAVSSIYYTSTAGTSTLLAAASYQTDYVSQQGPCRIMPAYGYTWPETISDTFKIVKVTFVSGYGAASLVPASIKNAMLLLIANWVEQREGVIIGTISSTLPFGVDACLSVEDWGHYS